MAALARVLSVSDIAQFKKEGYLVKKRFVPPDLLRLHQRDVGHFLKRASGTKENFAYLIFLHIY